jgi:two-component system OmpR family sensor kinase
MDSPSSWGPAGITPRAVAGGGILLALGWAFVAFHVATALGGRDTGAVPTALGTVIPLGLAVALFVGALCVYYYDLGGLAFRISGWTLFGTVAFSGVVGAALVAVDTALVDTATLAVVLVNVAASGAVTGLLIGLYDARQRRLHRQVATEHARAARLDQHLSVLRRVHRHDFRNKLNVVIGTAERLRATSDGDAEAARTIADAASDLHRITEDIHELDRLGTDAARRERVDLAAAVEDAVAAATESFPEATVDVEVPDTLFAHASPLVSRAVEELLDNALRYTDGQPPSATITATVESDTVELTVRDEGPGIPADEIAVHDAPTETALQHSDGLGLWLVNWIAEASEGEFDIDRPADGGTVATLRLAAASE